MARKGNRKKGVSGSETVLPKVVSEEESSEILINNKRKQKNKDEIGIEEAEPVLSDTNNYNKSTENELNTEERVNGTTESLEFSSAMILECLRIILLSITEASRKSHERLAPLILTLSTKTQDACKYVRMKIEYAYPIVFKWAMHFGKIMLLLFMVWLDCALRGFESFLRMRTTSFFVVLWCSVLSVIKMIGIFKFMLFLGVGAVIALFIGFIVSFLIIGICGAVLLWFYGSFWTTSFIVILGGVGFCTSRERIALFILTVYSVYCAWIYVGWLGLILAMNLSFLTSDALIYVVSNHMDQTRTSQLGDDIDSGIASTSGRSEDDDEDIDEVTKLLNSIDHYSVFGLTRFQDVDITILKREYRKKAMLVHPDKNMGNEKAVEAFKKLQNAYEVLLDSFKRKAYDDELRREEVLNYIRRFQNPSQKSRRSGLFGRTEVDDEEISAESRRIACRKCGDFHIWVYTKKSKSKARWCQECKDYHAAKDGDGWVEQSSQPFFFGIMQKVDTPVAFICAESRIYDATEWYICQGMRCPVNTHKPSFHINTNLTTKGKGTSTGGQRGVPMPENMTENMTEEEFFEWFQNAVQAGIFETPPSTSTQGPGSGNTTKTNNASKRKKKGKK